MFTLLEDTVKMTCYHPLKAFDVGINPDTGNKKIIVTPFEVKSLYREVDNLVDCRDPVYHRCYENLCWNYDKCFEEKRLCDPSSCDNFICGDSRVGFVYNRFTTIPCGRCIGCRIDASRDWATRMMLEEKYSLASWYITFTYSPEAETDVERDFHFVDSLGRERSIFQFPNKCPQGFYTLNNQDYSRFNKRLLKKFSDRLPDGKSIRFFICGEYGEEKGRMHHHGIYFNLILHEDEYYPYFIKNGYQYYRSPVLEDLWPFGMVILGKVTYESCSYVSRYCTKKFFTRPEDYEKKQMMPEFIQMSRNPGLGREWFDENFELLYSTYIINLSHGRQVPVPKYFYKLLEQKDPVRFESVRERQRLLGRNASLGAISDTDKGYLDYLKGCEETFKHSPKKRVWLNRERIKHA